MQKLDTSSDNTSLELGGNILTGDVHLATNIARSGDISIGHASSTGPITIDAGSGTVQCNTTGILHLDTPELRIGGDTGLAVIDRNITSINNADNIKIGNEVGRTGDIEIGSETSAGGQVTLGAVGGIVLQNGTTIKGTAFEVSEAGNTSIENLTVTGTSTVTGDATVTDDLHVTDNIFNGGHVLAPVVNGSPVTKGIYSSNSTSKFVGMFSDNGFSHKVRGFGACKLHLSNEEDQDITLGSDTISGNVVIGNSSMTGDIRFETTTTSTAVGNGSVVMDGGLSVSKTVNIGEVTTVQDTTASTSQTTGCLVLSGGLGVASDIFANDISTTDMYSTGNIFNGGHVIAPSLNGSSVNKGIFSSNSTSKFVGMFSDNGFSHKVRGFGSCTLHLMNEEQQDITVGVDTTSGDIILGNSGMTGSIKVRNTMTSSSVGNGSVVMDGGLSVAKQVNIGGDLFATNIFADNIPIYSYGTVIQSISINTAVSLDATAGTIETVAHSFSANDTQSFLFNNSSIQTTSIVHVSLEYVSGTSPTAEYTLHMGTKIPGSVRLYIGNASITGTTDTVFKVNFTIFNLN